VAIVFGVAVSGQNIDSILKSSLADSNKANILAEHAFIISDHNADSGIYFAGKGLKLALASHNSESQASCLNAAGWAFFRAGKTDSAKLLISHARDLFHSVGAARSEARALMNLSEIYVSGNRLDTALRLLLTTQQILRPDDKREMASSGRLMGVIYRRMGNNKQAKRYLSRAAENFLSIGQEKQYADVMGSTGIIFYDESRFDSALYCYRTALGIYSRLGNMMGVALMYDDLGHVYRVIGKTKPRPWLDSSLYYYKKAYEVFNSVNSKNDLPFEELGIGEVQSLKGDTSASLAAYVRALSGFMQLHDYNNIHNVLLRVCHLYAGKRDFAQAYHYGELARNYFDTLQQQLRSSEVAEILEKYESGKKDSIIHLLDENNKLLTTQASLARANVNKNRVIAVFAVVAALLAAALGIVLWNRYRMKQKLASVKMRNRISSDLHDDVGSSLSSIMLLSNIAASPGVQDKSELLTKISAAASDVAERMGDIVWATNPRHDDGESLRAKVLNYVAYLNESHQANIRAFVDERVKDMKFSMDVRRNVFLVIKEAVNNALKYANAPNIDIRLEIGDRSISLRVEDDGDGFEVGGISQGNGLGNMRSRIEGLGGRLSINSKPGEGTTVAATVWLMPERSRAKKRRNGKKQRKN